jgi:hypothetical protein
MKWNPITRRHFLQGLGASLALPLMPSLLSRAEAQTLPLSTKRFIAVGFENGVWPAYWYPTIDTATMPYTAATSYGYRSMALSSIAGPISEVIRDNYSAILGTAYTHNFSGTIRNDMNLVRGMDGMMPALGHRAGFMLGANADNLDIEDKKGPTIDQILAQSPKVYSRLPARRLLLCKADGGAEFSYTYDPITKTMQPGGSIFSPAEVFDRLFVRTDISQPTPRRAKKIVDLVLEDYRRVKNSSRISRDDFNQLDNHMTQLSQLQASFQTLACSGGTRPQDNFTLDEMSARIKRHMDLIAIAIKCGITQVAVLGLNGMVDHNVYGFLGTTSTYHDLTHAGHDSAICKKVTQFFAAHLPYLYNQLLEQEGTSGSRYIDNTLIYYGSHMARDHHQRDMPVILMGGKNFVNQGRYIDYRQQDAIYNGEKAGRNYSQLLVSIFAAMGLQPTDYQYPGVADGWGTDRLGYDYFASKLASIGQNTSFRTSRSSVLPGLLKV